MVRLLLSLGIFFSIGFTVPPVQSEDRFHQFKGQYIIDKGEFGIYLEGEIAKKLYQNMITKEEAENCANGFMKYDKDGMWCLRNKQKTEYTCVFGYKFSTRKFKGSRFYSC